MTLSPNSHILKYRELESQHCSLGECNAAYKSHPNLLNQKENLLANETSKFKRMKDDSE